MRTGSREQGFTLIEVMIAILLTVIAVVGIIAMYMTQTKASSFSRHSTEASALATDRLEKLRGISGSQATGSEIIDPVGTVVSGGYYERAWAVTVGADYTDIMVRVGWDEDEAAGAACAAHSTCTSGFCRPSTSLCAGRAVVVSGRRNN